MSAGIRILRHLYDFVLPAPPVCAFCQAKKTDLEAECENCKNERERLRCRTMKDGAYACFYYDGIVKDMVHRYKYQRNEFLCEAIADEIAERIGKNGITADYITFIPLHRSKRRKRGFDQAKAVADTLAELTGIPAVRLLVRVRRTKTQASLSPERRKQNVKNAFRVHNCGVKYKDSVIILIDDVYTTGATMAAAREALEKGGIKSVTPITFAVSTFGTDV